MKGLGTGTYGAFPSRAAIGNWRVAPGTGRGRVVAGPAAAVAAVVVAAAAGVPERLSRRRWIPGPEPAAAVAVAETRRISTAPRAWRITTSCADMRLRCVWVRVAAYKAGVKGEGGRRSQSSGPEELRS